MPIKLTNITNGVATVVLHKQDEASCLRDFLYGMNIPHSITTHFGERFELMAQFPIDNYNSTLKALRLTRGSRNASK